MLIAQITDIHLGFDADNEREFNRQRLDRTLETLCALDPLPDLLLATGDIADNGDDGVSYRRFREATAALPFPVLAAMGNHDSREPFLTEFPETPTADGFIQYTVEDFPVRILVLDTMEPGRHGGAFCDTRAKWLGDRLDEDPQRPTAIILHHPPIETGLSWMTENPDAAWVNRLAHRISGRDNIVAMIAGHLHRPVVTKWAGTILAVCPSTAPQVALDLTTMDPDRPDGRPMIVADHPFYALHYWNGRGLITHFDTAEDHEVLARYTPKLQPLVRMLMRENGEL